MNKAYDAVLRLLVVTIGLALAVVTANSTAAAGERYAAVTSQSSIASVFDRIDPDPDAFGGVTSGDVATTGVGESSQAAPPVPAVGARLARNSSASRHAFRNWRHRVSHTLQTRGDAVASKQVAAEPAGPAVPTVAPGKPEYRETIAVAPAPTTVANSQAVRPRRSQRSHFWTPDAQARTKQTVAPQAAPAKPAGEATPAVTPVAAAPRPTPEPSPKPVSVAVPAPEPVAARSHRSVQTSPPPPLKVAAVAPATVRVSTTNSGTVVLANSDQVERAVQAPQELEPVHDNPEVLEAQVTRGSTTHGRVNIMRVLTGKSLIIDLATDAKRVSVADPDVAEVMIITARQVMVNGLSDGETTIIIWDKRGNYTMYSLVVGDTLADQVMLEVTVAEINRTAMEKHGVDTRQFGGQFGSITQFGGVAPLSGQHPPQQGDPIFPLGLDGGISWAVVDLKNDIQVLFKQMQDENLGRILAEPKLLARSGKEASFLSGGEIPIVVTTNDDTSIEFKEFGTKIEFTPTVREDGTIDLILKSEVSEPDFTSGVELFGFKVPAFITRKTETEVTLASGESLIVAGLMKEVKQELESKMPFVGDIPLFGYFFRRTSYSNDVLELVVVVRPKLVRPIDAGRRVALPTDRGPLTRSEVRTGPEEEKVSRPRPF